MAYSEKVVDHYENPRNVGSFDKGDDSVGTGMVGAPACGDVMKLQIKVNPVTGVIHCFEFTRDRVGQGENFGRSCGFEKQRNR
jgi:nitrogen fixation NifU-like protein